MFCFVRIIYGTAKVGSLILIFNRLGKIFLQKVAGLEGFNVGMLSCCYWDVNYIVVRLEDSLSVRHCEARSNPRPTERLCRSFLQSSCGFEF